jgi:hypothetical protein
VKPSKEAKKSYTKLSTKDADYANRLNDIQDYKQINTFLNNQAPAAAAKHMDLVLKNRKDNQHRK